MKEALKLALEALQNSSSDWAHQVKAHQQAIIAVKAALAEQHLQALHDENVRLGLYASEASMHSNDRMTVDPITGNVSIGTVAQPDQEPDRFCDANCTWSNHHPDCKYGTQEPACSGCGKTNTPDSQWACYCVDCWTKAQPEQEPVGTVGDLFDERVISKRELDRDLFVYIVQPKENT